MIYRSQPVNSYKNAKTTLKMSGVIVARGQPATGRSRKTLKYEVR